MDSEKFLTAEEVCELLQIKRNSLYRWARRGVIPSYRLPSNKLRFKLSEIALEGHYQSRIKGILENSNPERNPTLCHGKEGKFEWEK